MHESVQLAVRPLNVLLQPLPITYFSVIPDFQLQIAEIG